MREGGLTFLPLAILPLLHGFKGYPSSDDFMAELGLMRVVLVKIVSLLACFVYQQGQLGEYVVRDQRQTAYRIRTSWYIRYEKLVYCVVGSYDDYEMILVNLQETRVHSRISSSTLYILKHSASQLNQTSQHAQT